MKKKRKQPDLTVEQMEMMLDFMHTIAIGAMVRAKLKEAKK